MNNVICDILNCVNIQFKSLENNSEILIERDILLDEEKYNEVKSKIPELKQYFSSSFLTSLQKNASESQKWPLLNLIRQILRVSMYEMKPIRKANGYKDGKKKYKRFFLIVKQEKKETNEVN